MACQTAPLPAQRGVIVVVVLSLLALLTVLAVSLHALVRLEQQAGVNVAAQARARAQALAALQIALGQLQRHLGPDGRVTAPAGGDTAQPAWVGVWTEGAADDPSTWLVSGNELDPLRHQPMETIATPDSPGAVTVWLLNHPLPASATAARVRLQPVEVRSPHPGASGRPVTGRYAFWVGDESFKLSVGEPLVSDVWPPEYPRPDLARVLGPGVPAPAERARLLHLDQGGELGLDLRLLRARWLEVTPLAWRVVEDSPAARLQPMAFNVNSAADADIWRAVLAPAEAALPRELQAESATLDAWWEQLLAPLRSGPRPWLRIREFQEAMASALPPEVDPAAFWARLEPVLTVRGDTFLVRAYGEVRNPLRTGLEAIDARAWLEATVQRVPEPHPEPALGRVFRIRDVRWLSPEEV